ncbi:S-methyl-5-thioribose kinase [Methylocapsa sp. S129]|uniref:S-methyl-5-thioribose kinase n=1 Tax=Methylocapsa sp. S129 TaxID=1641869 RepID=UPI00131D92BB|nr:S-methyl-5-thioribose kinase [Methylocapsa sp. S129]
MSHAVYAPVDGATLAATLTALPAISERLGGKATDWRIREVGDGNLNLVFIVEGEAGGIVVKQALPYVRLVGDSWPLPLERSWFEYNALTEQARYAPRLTPQVFHFDREQAMIVMEYLHPHVIMRKGLIRGVEYPHFAADIAEFLAATLFNTSVLAGSAAEHKARVALFAPNIALCKITEDLVFTDPYREAPLNRWNRPWLDAQKQAFERDAALKAAAQARKYQFMTSAQALIHGDLHTGSIMLTSTDTRVIDPEFAFIGPIGFDVGAVLGNLLIAYFAQEGHEAAPRQRDSYREWIFDQVKAVWTGFHDRFLALWRDARGGDAYPASLFTSVEDRSAMEAERQRFMRVIFEDSLAFAGAKMIRRILGLAHVEDLESIANAERRAKCESKALQLGRQLLLEAKAFSDIAEVVGAARAIHGA